jgi:hypothetical protein
MLAEAEYQIRNPVQTGYASFGKLNLFLEDAADALVGHTDDLSFDNCRIDRGPAVERGIDVFGDNDSTAFISSISTTALPIEAR